MSRLTLALLGPPQIQLDGQAVHWTYGKVQALLIYLAVEAHRVHTREHLASLLWPEYPNANARGNLRHALAHLRKTLDDSHAAPPFLYVTRDAVQFNRASNYWLDAEAFLRQTTSTCASAEAICRLEEAVRLYQGSFIEGFSPGDTSAFEEWARQVAERLERQVLGALYRLVEGYAARGQLEPACAHARRLLELAPWEEEAHRQLMRLLARNGQRSAALVQYEVCRRLLAEELGVEPAPETIALYEQIHHPGQDQDIPQARGATHLGPALTPLIGREVELEQIRGQLCDPTCRLLTLVGPGGSGKTHLALEVAWRAADWFAGEAVFVPLASVQSAEAIVPTMAHALRFAFHGRGDPKEQLLSYLQDKKLLLIMDNMEHLLEAVGIVAEVLSVASQCKVLATSRTRLNLQGEHLYLLSGLDVDHAAGELFLSGARRLCPGFQPAEEDRRAIGEICRQVQGIPLAILLATAWMGVLSPSEIATELARHSLDLLRADWRDVPERHRSMRAVLDRSWSLLTLREQEVFAGMSVFHGGFGREGVQAISGVMLCELRALVDKSLLQHTADGRYQMHELVRQYALEQLARSADGGYSVRDQHAAYYASALERWAADLGSPREQEALAELEVEIENARTAWEWAVEQGQVERIGQAMEGLVLFYESRGRYPEGGTICRAAMDGLEGQCSIDTLRLRARALAWQSAFVERLGRVEDARQLALQSLAVLDAPGWVGHDTRREEAFALLRLAASERYASFEKAQQTLKHSLSLYRELGDRWEEAASLCELGWVTFRLGSYEEARWLHEESVSIWRSLGGLKEIARALHGLSAVALHQGQLEEAERLIRESISVRQGNGDQIGLMRVYGHLGLVLAVRGQYAEAQTLFEQVLAFYNEIGERVSALEALRGLAEIEITRGAYKQARALAESCLAGARELSDRAQEGDSCLLLSKLALVEKDYPAAWRWAHECVTLYQRAFRRSKASEAFAILACAERGLGHHEEAQRSAGSALRAESESRASWMLVFALSAIALLLADRGAVEQAVELYALVSRRPDVSQDRWFEDVVGQELARAAAALPPEMVAAARERGRTRDMETAVTELPVEFPEWQPVTDAKMN